MLFARAQLGLLLCLAAVVPQAVREQQGGPPAAPEQADPKEAEGDDHADDQPDITMGKVVRGNLEPSYLAYPIGLSGLSSRSS
jgi:hypothetical protein